MPKLLDSQCLVGCFEPGLAIAFSSWSSVIVVLSDFHFALQQGYILKRVMHSHFLILLPCDCITKIANNFEKGTTFEKQMLIFLGGMDDSICMVMGRNEPTMSAKNR
jgi:hypothetical protein